MITLTYPGQYTSDGATVKGHLRAFLQALRRVNNDVSYLWFLEFQKRGAPHFHVLTRGIQITKERKEWVSKRWYAIVGSKDERHLRAGTRTESVRKKDGAKRYAVKYAYKMKQKRVPEGYRNVGRFWGHSKDVKPIPIAEVECNEDDIIAGLEIGEWEYLRGDALHYRVLYGVSDILTEHFDGAILVPSTSGQTNNKTGG
ncbi:rolling circle replication-associated protein [Methanohalophilus sp.]